MVSTRRKLQFIGSFVVLLLTDRDRDAKWRVGKRHWNRHSHDSSDPRDCQRVHNSDCATTSDLHRCDAFIANCLRERQCTILPAGDSPARITGHQHTYHHDLDVHRRGADRDRGDCQERYCDLYRSRVPDNRNGPCPGGAADDPKRNCHERWRQLHSGHDHRYSIGAFLFRARLNPLLRS